MNLAGGIVVSALPITLGGLIRLKSRQFLLKRWCIFWERPKSAKRPISNPFDVGYFATLPNTVHPRRLGRDDHFQLSSQRVILSEKAPDSLKILTPRFSRSPTLDSFCLLAKQLKKIQSTVAICNWRIYLHRSIYSFSSIRDKNQDGAKCDKLTMRKLF